MFRMTMALSAPALFVLLGVALNSLPSKTFVIKNSAASLLETRDAMSFSFHDPSQQLENGEAPPVIAEVGREDIALPHPLMNHPETVKAIYATNWSAGRTAKVEELLGFISEHKLNAMVIDIKDFSGVVGYAIPKEVDRYGAVEVRIPAINALIKKLHDKGIYAIGRIAVFQDQKLIKTRPDLALYRTSDRNIWRDRKGLGWIDPASEEAWEYHAAIAKDAFSRGFDEINFDYIRFPSDGDLDDIGYPIWDMKTPQEEVIQNFAAYLRSRLRGAVISADIFGLATVEESDLGIGQRFERLLPYFDYIAPMAYPSHYGKGFLGYANPARYPFEVVAYSLQRAKERVVAYEEKQRDHTSSTTPAAEHASIAKIRPWLQAFDLGDTYDTEKIRAQIQAVESEGAAGFMLWSPSNTYVAF